MTAVNRKTSDKTGSAGDNVYTLSDGEEYESETDLRTTDDKAEYETMSSGLCEARKKLQYATKSRRFYEKGDNGREHVTSNRPKSIQELKKVTDMQSMWCAGSLGG